jgi:hypothetical protein
MNDGEIIKNKKVAKILELFDKINNDYSFSIKL